MRSLFPLVALFGLIAPVAHAEVSFSGDARMGVVVGDNNTDLGFRSDAEFSSRLRVKVTMSGETDGGLTFGGSFRMDQAADANAGAGGSVFISGAFGTLAMGEVDGAAETVVGDLPEVGFTGLDSVVFITPLDEGFRDGSHEIAYLSDAIGAARPGDPAALYTYANGPLTLALSAKDGGPDEAVAAGLRYASGGYSLGIAYERARPGGVGAASTHVIIGGGARLGTTDVQAFYGDGGGFLDGFSQYGVGVTTKLDALTLKGYAKRVESFGVAITSWGVGGAYDLGGGATIEGGIADNDFIGFPGGVQTSTKTVADLGIKFTF